MNKAVLAAATIIAVAAMTGGAYAWALREGQAEISQTTDQIRAALGPGGSFSYESADVHPFALSADFTRVVLRAASGELVTAERVVAVSGGFGKVASIHVDGLRVSGAAEDGTVTAASLDGKDISFREPAEGQPLNVDLAAWTFPDLTLRDVSVTRPGVSASAAFISLQDYGAGCASTVTISDFSAPVPNVEHVDRAGFASVTVSGLDLARLVQVIKHDGTLPQLSPGAVHLEMNGLYAANGTDRPITVKQALLSGSTGGDNTPTAVNVQVSGVSIAPTDADSAAQFATVGLTKVSGSLVSNISYRRAGGEFEMAPTLDVDGVGTLTMGFRLAHLDLSALAGQSPNPLALLGMASAVRLVSAHAEFVDRGALEFGLTNAAKRSGLTKDQVRARAIATISHNPTFAKFPNGEHARAVLASFVRRGGRVGVAVQPRKPLNVMGMVLDGQADPPRLVAQVELSVTGGGYR